MSAATLEREGGDDRDPRVEIEKLHEMFDQESAPEPLHIYVPDVMSKTAPPDLQPAIGDIVLERKTRVGITGHRAGSIVMRRVHIRPANPQWIE